MTNTGSAHNGGDMRSSQPCFSSMKAEIFGKPAPHHGCSTCFQNNEHWQYWSCLDLLAVCWCWVQTIQGSLPACTTSWPTRTTSTEILYWYTLRLWRKNARKVGRICLPGCYQNPIFVLSSIPVFRIWPFLYSDDSLVCHESAYFLIFLVQIQLPHWYGPFWNACKKHDLKFYSSLLCSDSYGFYFLNRFCKPIYNLGR